MREVSENNFGALVIVLAGCALWASGGGYTSGIMGMMYGWGYPGILPFAIVGLLALDVYVVLTELGRPHAVEATALRSVNERYARGEITREQYLQMKRELDA